MFNPGDWTAEQWGIIQDFLKFKREMAAVAFFSNEEPDDYPESWEKWLDEQKAAYADELNAEPDAAWVALWTSAHLNASDAEMPHTGSLAATA